MAESAPSNTAIYVVEGELVETEESEGEGRHLDDSRPRIDDSSPKIGGMIGNMLGEDEDHPGGNEMDADNNENNSLAAASSLSVEEPFLPMDDPISLFDDDHNGGNYNDVKTNNMASLSASAVAKKFDYAPIDDSNYESVNDDVPTKYGLSSPASATASTTHTTTTITTSRGKKPKGKLRYRFPRGNVKKRKQKQKEQLEQWKIREQQQQQQQGGHLYLSGAKKFLAEYNDNIQLHEDVDEDLDDGYSWGALLPPYDINGGTGNDNGDSNNNINFDNDDDDSPRRVRFDIHSNQEIYDNEQDVRMSKSRIVKYKTALKIVGLIGIVIVCSTLSWFVGTKVITGEEGEEGSSMSGNIVYKKIDDNGEIIVKNSTTNTKVTQPPYDVRNEATLPTLKPTISPRPTLKPINPESLLAFKPATNSTHSPTLSPTQDCNLIQIEVVTGILGVSETLSWTLIKYDTSEIILEGGPLSSDERTITGGKEGFCVTSGRYIFNITNSGGHGFGSLLGAKQGGYYLIYSNHTLVGGSDSFFLNEEFSFQVPYYGDEPDGDEIVHCSNDFFMVFFTDGRPEQNRFELFHNDSGQVLVRGGPYHVGPNALYYSRACLPDGVFNLTLFDSAGDGVMYPGHFQIYVEEKFIDLQYKIGSSNSTSFVLANHPKPTSRPTVAGCENFLALISTNLDQAHSYYDHNITWELLHIDTGDIILNEGPISHNANLTYNECIPPGRYSFNITNTRGDGLGPKGNYLIFSDTLMIGGSTKFGLNEEMVFSLPYDVDELSGREFDWCAGDFYLKLATSANPQLIAWTVTNETGGIFASGGPYRKPFGTYSQWACLPNGSYNLNIRSLDIVGKKENKITVFVESKLLVSITDDDFGQEYSTSFDLK